MTDNVVSLADYRMSIAECDCCGIELRAESWAAMLERYDRDVPEAHYLMCDDCHPKHRTPEGAA